jgi:hypothetical protein
MPKLTTIKLARVQYIPKYPEPGILYVSEEFEAAVHLCACGCGAKVSTPLGPTEWSLTETTTGPSLYPSVGNWQFPCRSHYWIQGGQIIWSETWTPSQVQAGHRAEEDRRRAYYDSLKRGREGILRRIYNWLKSLFR